jgi:hypothetical protein
MGVPEQTAFAFLSFTAKSGDATALLGRSLAAYTAGAVERAEQVTDVLRTLGRQFRSRGGRRLDCHGRPPRWDHPSRRIGPEALSLPPGRDVQALRRGKAPTGVQDQSRSRPISRCTGGSLSSEEKRLGR